MARRKAPINAPWRVLDWAIAHGLETVNDDPRRMSARDIAFALGEYVYAISAVMDELGYPRMDNGAFVKVGEKDVERIIAYFVAKKGQAKCLGVNVRLALGHRKKKQ